MSTTRSIVLYSFRRLHTENCPKFQAFCLNPNYITTISKHKDGLRFLGNGSLQSLITSKRDQIGINTKINMAIYRCVQPGAPLPSAEPPNSWKTWILGMLLSVILPFLGSKWGPLLKLKKEVETVVDTAERIADVVEEVAEKVEKVADEVADHLPEGGKLKDAVTFVENFAEETAKDAHLAGDVFDKMEEVEKEVESFIEPGIDEANETANEAKEQK